MRLSVFLVFCLVAASAAHAETALPAQRPADFALTYGDRSDDPRWHKTLRIVGNKAEIIDHLSHPSVARALRVAPADIDALYSHLRRVGADSIRVARRPADGKPSPDVTIEIRWANEAVSLRANAREEPSADDENRFVTLHGVLLGYLHRWERDR
jgi:hypothetical protein